MTAAGKLQEAAQLVDRAHAAVTTGRAEGGGALSTPDEAFAEWSRATGIDYKDPEQLKKVYDAVATITRNRAEAEAKRAKHAARVRVPKPVGSAKIKRPRG